MLRNVRIFAQPNVRGAFGEFSSDGRAKTLVAGAVLNVTFPNNSRTFRSLLGGVEVCAGLSGLSFPIWEPRRKKREIDWCGRRPDGHEWPGEGRSWNEGIRAANMGIVLTIPFSHERQDDFKEHQDEGGGSGVHCLQIMTDFAAVAKPPG